MHRRRLTCAAALLVAFPASLEAQRAPGWQVRTEGRAAIAETQSQARGGALRLQCVQNRSVWLTYFPPRGWNGNGAVSVRIGTAVTPMTIDGGDGAILSNAAGGMGITRALFDAIRSGPTLVLEGPATGRVPAGQRTFSLRGAEQALGAIERSCPGFR